MMDEVYGTYGDLGATPYVENLVSNEPQSIRDEVAQDDGSAGEGVDAVK